MIASGKFVSSLTLDHILDLVTNNIATICIFLLVFYLTWTILTRPRNLPPGPWGIPILGYLPFMRKDLAVVATELGKRYNSDIVTYKIMNARFVYLNSFELIKEVLQKRLDVTDRPNDALLEVLRPGHHGILMSNGELWKEHRRFALTVLRDFGMGKMTFEEKVRDELSATQNEFGSLNGAPINPQDLAMGATCNIICNIIFGERFDYNNTVFLEYLHMMNGISRLGNTPIAHWMKYFPIDLFGYHTSKSHIDKMVKTSKEKINAHRANFDPENIRDYIDAYLLKAQEEPEHNNTFTASQLIAEIFDLFLAGTETSSTTLRWGVYYMAKYQDIQKKAQEEIDSQIGQDRLPTMKDKLLLPYTEAVLMEVQRMATILGSGVSHSNNTEDIEIRGYTIPKESRILPNVYAIHHDPKIWPDPDNFNPNNFLDENGKIMNQDKLIPFSVGRRSCAGEALAKMELFLFFIGWLQKFNIVCPEGKTLPGTNWSIIVQPKDYEVCFLQR